MRSEDVVSRDDQIATKNIGKDDSKIWMVEDAPKSSINVVTMLKYFIGRIGDVCTPEMP
jgi:hypothetical protein